ncbi:MAG: hypothetical protein Q9216_004193 [Gyalolechia sp. 2 TL-2023]
MQHLEDSQNRNRIEQHEHQQLRRQYDQFVESLHFSEMNLRMNEVSPSHPNTFQWMFDDSVRRSWSRFTDWLIGSDCIYWIQGKPGSGKTTLMKFLANDPRTENLLKQWSPEKRTLVVTFYFWLSGNKLQRSLKGLLCSLCYQILLDERSLFSSICGEETLLIKRSVHDWSEKELHHLLVQLIDLFDGSLCMFIDGLDEFDQNEDVNELFVLVERLSKLVNVKICVSSRPENHIFKQMSKHAQARLQDLTKSDIQLFIHDSLNDAWTKYSPTLVDEKRLDQIVRVMTEKADGVFLWVHYALSSLRKGMSNEDDFEDLLDRIEQLPSGMYQLYTQMWNRLNEDQQRYRDEATMYFSYESFFPLSVLELLIALDESLQNRYLDGLEPQIEAGLAERCKRLTTRILTRCAGMLEVVPDEDSDSDLKAASGSRRSYNPDSVDTLDFHHKSKIKFLHRTARDFLLETKDGHVISGDPVDSLERRFRNVVRARTANLIQGLTELNRHWIRKILKDIADFGTDDEIELLSTIRRACEFLSIPGRPSRHVGFRKFWDFSSDFECAAAEAGCMEYIRDFVQNGKLYVSPYYRGLLLIRAVRLLRNSYRRHCSLFLTLISWLISNGADVLTNHIVGFMVTNPASQILEPIAVLRFETDPKRVKQAAEAFQSLLPLIHDSSRNCIQKLRREYGWRWGGERVDRPYGGGAVWAQMTIAKLSSLAVPFYQDHMVFDPQWSCCTFDEQHVTKVIRISGIPGIVTSSLPSNEDSIYLGEALDDVLFWDETSSLSLDAVQQVFEERLAEVRNRSARKDIGVWVLETGWWVGTDRLTKRTLDPSEDVDESNWTERGHFKKSDKVLDSQSASSASPEVDRVKSFDAIQLGNDDQTNSGDEGEHE